jgi:hypothetical protein
VLENKEMEKNGLISVKGNETVLLMAENGTRKVRNNLPKLELGTNGKKYMQQ